MEYLFWSNIIVWASIFIYVIYLILENKSLNKEIDSLRSGSD
ncbi:MAG: CcmD family protein [Candidatus Dadabacteria bacterium]|nr:CcmD family protein [Candidatus Dadabacteria bacterium]NIQ14108.1 CcmD family protein [Candidatus Dadabacteria bacterium]